MPKLREPPLPEEVFDSSKPSGNGSLVLRDAKGRVLEGAVLNPRGRTPGSKDRITQAFLTDLQALWEDHGPAILKRIAKKNPQAILAAMVALVPKAQVVDETRRIYRMRDTPLSPEEWKQKHAAGVPLPKTGETPH
jgi:hypothetical protein